MDYQTYQHLPSSLGGGSYSTSSLPVSSAPPTLSPAHAQPAFSPPSHQQQHHPPSVYGGVGAQGDPQARFGSHQQQPFPQAHQFNNGQAGGFPLASSMGGGNMSSGSAMMQPGDVSQHQLQHARGIPPGQPSPSPYSSAPYSQSLQSPALSAAQKFAQQQSQFHRPSASPTHSSPYATPQHQSQSQQPHQSPNLNSNPPQHGQQQLGSMAAPQSTTPQQVQTPMKNSMPPSPGPQSPAMQTKDKERVTVLLEINSQLLQEVCSLQAQGKSGYMGQMPPPKEDGKPDTEVKPASKEYLECMRRLQANLSYLASFHERTKQPQISIPPGPAIVNSFPNAPPALTELYSKLQALFPNWKGGQMKQSPGPQRPGAAQQQQTMTPPQQQPQQVA